MKNVEKVIKSLLEGVDRVLLDHQELREEFELMLKRSLDDRPMALGRARRLLEVLVVDEYIRAHKLKPPYGEEVKVLSKMIEDLAKQDIITKTEKSLCHAVRTEGNAALHYNPNKESGGIRHDVDSERVVETLRKLCEVLEGLAPAESKAAGYSARTTPDVRQVYRDWLTPNFRQVYSAWQQVGCLEKLANSRDFLDLLLRSMLTSLLDEDVKLLNQAFPEAPLPADLPIQVEYSYRRLRNVGAITHNLKHLFDGARSTRVYVSPRGEFLVKLWQLGSSPEGRPTPSLQPIDEEKLVSLGQNVEEMTRKEMSNKDEALRELLHRLQSEGGKFAPSELNAVRKLRSLSLVGHKDALLQSAKSVHITDLGYYVLGDFDKS